MADPIRTVSELQLGPYDREQGQVAAIREMLRKINEIVRVLNTIVERLNSGV